MKIYRDILKRSWQILWRFYWLWPLGLLTALAGNGGEYNILSLSREQINNQASALTALKQTLRADQLKEISQNLMANFSASPIASVWLIVVILAVLLLAIWIITVSQAALIKAAGNIDAEQPISLVTASETGIKKFWPIFWLNALTRFITALLLIVAYLPFLISFLANPNNNWNFNALLVISYLISIPLTIILSFILRYAAIYIVLENESWWSALEKGLNLFFKNWLISLETAAILFFINLALGFSLFLVTPNTIALEVYVLLTNFNFLTLFRLLPIFLLFIVAGMWFAVFQYVTWTLLFRRLRAGSVTAKLTRWRQDLPIKLPKWFKKN
ncbi:hypothetical protein KKC17_01425 [Patescibacteria group bacterium]|nr:hypothetical protein [Patescibacteria group bacterium]